MTALRYSAATFGHGTLWKVGFLALVYLDLLLTLYAVDHGFRELNPFVSSLLSRPVELLLIKGIAPIGIAWLVPARLLLPSVCFMFLVVGWNIGALLLSL